MKGTPSLTAIGQILGDPTRALILEMLYDGRAWSASELANAAGITPQTASSHLGKLTDANLLAVEPQFRYLVNQRKKWGFLVFFNINICRTNIGDVKRLTEIARENGVGTDYHLNEAPPQVADIDHFKYPEFDLGITPAEYDEVEELLNWLIARQKEGWCMVNSIPHLQSMKERIRGRISPWNCRAGHNGGLIRPDGTLSPCFDLITYDHDWGKIWEPRFDADALRKVRESCLTKCSSTCFHTMASYYNLRTISQWIVKHTQMG